jgi:putative ATP-binding cassette transporter
MEAPRRIIIRTAWCLAKSYWTSEEKRSAWNLLVVVIVLNLGNVYIGVRINEWNRAFYNALQTFNAMALFRQIGIFGILVAFAVLASVSALYLNQLLQIRWRRWLTKRYLAAWLADRAYYKLQLGNAADNPDQRIAEDLNQFTGYILTFSLGLISSIVSLFSFLTILWGLSGAANIPLGALGTAHIPGYLVWSALTYAGLGTWLAVTIGRPLVALNSARQRALDAALICVSLDIVHYELTGLERLRLYAKLLSDWQTVTILNAILDDVVEAKHRLAELMALYVGLDPVSEPNAAK